jgi:hypothetical protein
MAAQRRTRQGGYVGIDQYLGANKQGGERLAGTMAEDLTKRHAGHKANIGKLQTGFTEQSGAERIKDISGQIKADPTKITSEQFGRTVGGYQGPSTLQDIEGYGKTAAGVEQFGSRLGMTETQPGQTTLLREQFGKPQYTRGQSRLDAALLSAAPGARDKFANIRQSLGGLGSELGAAESTAAGIGSQYLSEGQKYSDLARSTLSSERENLLGALESERDRVNQAREAEYQAELDKIMGQVKSDTGGSLLERIAARKADERNKAQAQFLTQGKAAGISDIATDEQRARDAALATLAGNIGFLGEGQDLGQAFNFDQAGWNKVYQDKFAPKDTGFVPKSTADKAYVPKDIGLEFPDVTAGVAQIGTAKDPKKKKKKKSDYREVEQKAVPKLDKQSGPVMAGMSYV